MKRLSANEISVYQAVEADAQDLVAAATKKHADALRPRISMTGVHENWETDTRPRYRGAVLGPVSKQD
jgi:hypothetical protein